MQRTGCVTPLKPTGTPQSVPGNTLKMFLRLDKVGGASEGRRMGVCDSVTVAANKFKG